MFRTRRARRSVLAGVAITAVAASLAIAGISDANAASNPGPVKPKVLGAGAMGAIPDSYVVVLKNSAVKASAVKTSAASLTKLYGGTVTRTYKNGLRGFAAHMSAAQAQKVAASPDVKYVQQNHRFTKSDTIQYNVPSWGLDRLDQIFAPLNKRYTYPNTASNVHAYVIDTGIRITHSEFGGRASYGYDFVDNDAIADDCFGHGTHVAGTIGGTNYGVAKQVQLVAVRVLDCGGAGTTDEVVAGIDWVTANAIKPAVANMSLGSVHDQAVDDAVNAAINSGITFSVAAGNSGDDACKYSPADVPNAITVGASDELDFITSFSNTGSCVDINAPGNAIPSAYYTSDTATEVMSGTSMASPHVAGAAAIALSANPTWTPAQVRNFLVYGGTRRVVRNTLGSKTTDVILKIAGPNTPQVTGLRSLVNGKNITTGTGGNQPIKAATPLTTMGDMEKFTTLSVGDGYYTFASWANGKLMTATNNGAGSLIANGTTAGDAQKFKPITNTDGTVTLQAKINNKYVTVPSGGTSPLVANATTIGNGQKFIWATPSAILVLRSRANGKIVTTPSGGSGALVASVTGTQGGNAEQFDMIDLGNQLVTLRAHSNKKFVTSASPSSNLVANATSAGATQQFLYWHYGDGSILLQQPDTGYVVQATSNGAGPLRANQLPTEELPPPALFDYVPIKVG